MNQTEEYLFTVDQYNHPFLSETRSIVHKQGIWHRVTAVWVINKQRQILCQQRSHIKDINPGMWEACFGGHVRKGEDPNVNAVNELREELNITADNNLLRHYKVFKSDKPSHKTFVYVYSIIIENQEFDIQNEEIDHIEWRDLAEIESILLDLSRTDWVKKASDYEVIQWLKSLNYFQST